MPEADADIMIKTEAQAQCTKIELENISTASHAEGDHNKRIQRIRRRVDLRLVWVLSAIYMWAFIDRANLGNANIAGMAKDLRLEIDSRYQIVAQLFFVTYVLVDLPAAIVVRKLGATVFIPSIAVAWGVVTIGQGFVHSWGPLVACRMLLGAFEGCLVPSAMYLIGVWYTRYEQHKRLASFYVLGIASTGFSGLLAYGIEKMNGDAHLAGWRWIFILEGSITCVFGIAAYFLLVDFPELATQRNRVGMPAFLTADEVTLMLNRLDVDRGDSAPEKVTRKSLFSALRDWKLWEFNLYVLLNNTALYAFSYFLPVILRGSLRYSVGKAQLFTFPPYAVGAVWMLVCAWVGDRLKIRGPILIANCSLYIIGISMTGFCTQVHTRYSGVFLGVMGITANVPTNLTYQHNNIAGQAKRALSAAMLTTGGGLGGIVAGNIFQEKDAPGYKLGLSICIAFQALQIVLVAKNFFVFGRANKRAERGEILIEDTPGFRYTL